MDGGGTSRRRIARTAGLIGLGAAMLMAVTVLIGRPTLFTDTDDYFSQGRDVARAMQVWATKGKPPIVAAEIDDRLHDPGDQDEEPVHNQNGARSVYYGLVVWACEQFGTLWLLAAVQAVLAAAVVHTLWRVAAPGARARSYLLTMAVLAVGSSLPVFTGFAMPDLFAGFAVVATLLVTLCADRFGPWGKAELWLLLLASVNFHGSNLLTSLCLAAAALAWLGWRGAGGRRVAARGAAVLAAVAVSLLAAKAYAVGIKLRTGDELGRPPFLTARVLADGPGREYLRHACAPKPVGLGEKLLLCPYRRAPLDDTEVILWSDDPAKGIFNSADYHARVKIEQDQSEFVLHAVAYDPLRELGAALRNFGLQLVSVSYAEPLRDPAYYLTDDYWKTTTLKPLLLRARRCDPEVGGCILNVPAVAMAELDAAIALAALGWIGFRLVQATRRPVSPCEAGGGDHAKHGEGGVAAVVVASGAPPPPPCRRSPSPASQARKDWRDPVRRTRALVVFMLAGVAINAAVCGVLSGPFDRYQARLLWLVPAAALLLETARRTRRRNG